jgi:phosphoadenosine phosphosulfate reductase
MDLLTQQDAYEYAVQMPLAQKVKKSIELLKSIEGFREMFAKQYLPGMAANDLPQLCFSGGNDSVCIKALADMAGLEYEAVYSVTTIDPPELVKFIKREHSDVKFNYPRMNFFKMMETRGFPLTMRRWCCDEFKHNTGNNAIKIVGVRAEESWQREIRWKTITRWNNGEKLIFCVILFWTFSDRNEFIKAHGLRYCELYDEGFNRLGCIGCPMSSACQKRKEFKRWPKFEFLWRRSFERMWENKAGTFKKNKEWFGSM